MASQNSKYDPGDLDLDLDVPSTSSGVTRKRLSNNGPEIELGEKGDFPTFVHYMGAKITKLLHQVHSKACVTSDLFKGVSIFVNGYTTPPAAELRRLIVENGGEYHHYYKHGLTKYVVAMNLAKSKLAALRKDEVVLHPRWVIDSLQNGELLPIEAYLLTRQMELNHNVLRTHDKPEMSASRFYERSRLHLISTLAQEMKEFVAEMRSNIDKHEFTSRSKLEHLAGTTSDNSSYIVHLDMDCFFVSIGLRSRPELVGKPVVITHSKSATDRGKAEIASCSYEARKFDIKNGMWMSDAVKKCPDLVCLPYQFEEYRASSKQLYSIIARYTLDIKAVSCDEMYFDIQSLCQEMNIGDVSAVVKVIRDEIFEELKCNASAGIGPCMLVARLATKKAKPNGQFVVSSSDVCDFMQPIKIKDIPGVGYSALCKIKDAFGDIETCGELQNVLLSDLKDQFGAKLGEKVFNSCRGQGEDMEFTDSAVRKSISCDINFGIRANSSEELEKFLHGITEELSKRLEQARLVGSHLTLRLLIRLPDAPLEPEKYGAHGPCDQVSKSVNLAIPASNHDRMHQAVMKMLKQLDPVPSDVRGERPSCRAATTMQGCFETKKKNFLCFKASLHSSRHAATRSLLKTGFICLILFVFFHFHPLSDQKSRYFRLFSHFSKSKIERFQPRSMINLENLFKELEDLLQDAPEDFRAGPAGDLIEEVKEELVEELENEITAVEAEIGETEEEIGRREVEFKSVQEEHLVLKREIKWEEEQYQLLKEAHKELENRAKRLKKELEHAYDDTQLTTDLILKLQKWCRQQEEKINKVYIESNPCKAFEELRFGNGTVELRLQKELASVKAQVAVKSAKLDWLQAKRKYVDAKYRDLISPEIDVETRKAVLMGLQEDLWKIGLTMTKLSKPIDKSVKKGALYKYLTVLKNNSMSEETDTNQSKNDTTNRTATSKASSSSKHINSMNLKTGSSRGTRAAPVCENRRWWVPRKVNPLPKPPPGRKSVFDAKAIIDGLAVLWGDFVLNVHNPVSHPVMEVLTENLKILVDRGEFRKCKLVWSYFDQVMDKVQVKIMYNYRCDVNMSIGWLDDLCLVFSSWEMAFNILKYEINEYCRKKEGSVLWPIVMPIEPEEADKIRSTWDKVEQGLYDGLENYCPELREPMIFNRFEDPPDTTFNDPHDTRFDSSLSDILQQKDEDGNPIRVTTESDVDQFIFKKYGVHLSPPKSIRSLFDAESSVSSIDLSINLTIKPDVEEPSTRCFETPRCSTSLTNSTFAVSKPVTSIEKPVEYDLNPSISKANIDETIRSSKSPKEDIFTSPKASISTEKPKIIPDPKPTTHKADANESKQTECEALKKPRWRCSSPPLFESFIEGLDNDEKEDEVEASRPEFGGYESPLLFSDEE